MNPVKRNHCVFTHKKDLELLHSFKNFPVFMGCVTHPREKDIFMDMNWHISQGSGSLQLNPLVPMDILYQRQHNDGTGSLWMKFYKEFASFLSSYPCKNIFEIGGAHGILSKMFQSIKPKSQWTMVEPNPELADGVNAKIIKSFFDEKFIYPYKFDAVVHSHLLEHLYDPSQILKNISKFSPEGTYHIFAVPNMKALLENLYTNCLNFEHTIFLIEPYIDAMLKREGFEILKKEYFLKHSIFYATKKTLNSPDIPFPNLYNENQNLFMHFIKHHQKLIKSLNKKIASASSPIYLFGAHIFSLYLIAFGLKTDKIISVLDNSPRKQGQRLYGSHLKVDSPKILKDQGKINIILKAGDYNPEIKKDILININDQVIFWE